MHIEPIAIVDNNNRPALPLELALALLHRLRRSVWGGHKVWAVRVLQQIFVKNLSAFLQKSHLGSALVGHLGFVTAHRMNLIGDHLGQQ